MIRDRVYMCILAGRNSEDSEITFLNGPEELDEDD
jgi:hypothetical protein